MTGARDVLGLVDSVFIDLSMVEQSMLDRLHKLKVTEIGMLGADIQNSLDELRKAKKSLLQAHAKYQRLIDEY